MESGARQILRWGALGALFLIPLTPLIVASPFFFPFISGKAFFFRILVEIAFCLWVALAVLDKEYRPRFSWIGAAVVAFVLWMLVADAFALNATKAFWSNFERMEGWVLLAHLLALFFTMSGVLRVEKKWRAWFLASLGVSVIVCGHALLQLAGGAAIHQSSARIDASLGNSIYLGIYLLFNTCIALWLALTEERAWLKWSLIGLAALEAVLIFFTETRGTIVGLTLALSLAALLTAATAGKRARAWAAGALVLILVLVGGFYLARNSSFVQSHHVLQRLASITLKDGQVRFTLWRMALEGARERPFGWGQEGFNYVFNKFYDPSLYQQEPWFDRAHNAFIDWLTAGGIPAFAFYLALFGTAITLLWTHSQLSRPERIALTAALVGYAVHNIFVFDNLYSYVYFFAILALIDSQTARPIELLERAPELSPNAGFIYALPVSAVAVLTLVWLVNVPGMRVGVGLIDALTAHNAEAALVKFEELAAHPSFAGQEVREQVINMARQVVQNSASSDTEKQRAVTLAVTEMQKQVTAYPQDTRGYLQLSYAYRTGGDAKGALDAVQAALVLSPKRQMLWLERGILEWDSGAPQAARKSFDTAYALGPEFPELASYAAAGAIITGDRAEAKKILLEAYGTTTVDNQILGIAYLRAEDWPSLIALWKLRTERPDVGPQPWFALAQAYYLSGDNAAAIRTLRTAMQLFPSPDVLSAGTAGIAQIEGKIPLK